MNILSELGGKSGKLKCEICGKLRFTGRNICPGCYYDQLNFYVCQIIELHEDGEWYYLNDNENYYVLVGLDIFDAMKKAEYHGKFGTAYIDERKATNVKEFKDKELAVKYAKKLNDSKLNSQ